MSRKKEMAFYVEEITPELAKDFLGRNTDVNRNLSPSKVAKLAAEMTAGKWRVTHEAIAFDRESNLIDGQHRLAAVIEAGVSVMMLIVDNCDPESFKVIGCGSARSSADLFVISYKRKYGQAPAKATYVASVATGMIARLVTTAPSREEVTEQSLKHYKLITKILEGFDKRGVKSVCGTRVMAAFANAALYFGAPKIDPLMERITTQMWASVDDPLKILYTKLANAKMGENRDRRARLSEVERYAAAVSAIRASLQGKKLQRLEPTTQDVGESDLDKRIRRGTAPSLAGEEAAEPPVENVA